MKIEGLSKSTYLKTEAAQSERSRVKPQQEAATPKKYNSAYEVAISGRQSSAVSTEMSKHFDKFGSDYARFERRQDSDFEDMTEHEEDNTLVNEIYKRMGGKIPQSVSYSYHIAGGIEASITMPGATVEFRSTIRESAVKQLEYASSRFLSQGEADGLLNAVGKFYDEDILRELGIEFYGSVSEKAGGAGDGIEFDEFAKRFGGEGFYERMTQGSLNEGEYLNFISKLSQNRQKWAETLQQESRSRSEAISRELERIKEIFDKLSAYEPDFLDNIKNFFKGRGGETFAQWNEIAAEYYGS
ncbi:MAG: hypothetical protein LBL09_00615 [Oscillospiraceae bacterium]|nr:hypothetical protein [Oscillospiraceae bacterium]